MRVRTYHLKKNLLFLCLLLMKQVSFSQVNTPVQVKKTMEPNFAIAIHGGAGTILKQNMTPEKDSAYRKTLTESLQTGYDILKKGGTALDAVEAAVRVMEDSPLFNAG